jgi:hypothetical protein
MDVGTKRSDASTYSSTVFAVELAYVIKTYSKQTEKEALEFVYTLWEQSQ